MADDNEVAMQPCATCKNVRLTKYIEFHRNVGMLYLRRTYVMRGKLCKTCVRKYFWEFELKNLLLGPWGVISLVVTPIYLIQNVVTYVGARSKLRNAVE